MEVVEQTEKYPTGLKTADEISESLKGAVTSERLTELADSGYAPHLRIDGGLPMFRITELKNWLMSNVVDICSGSEMQIKVLARLPEAKDTPPEELRHIDNLRQVVSQDYEPCVYFLCKQDRVVYVGQSISVVSRVSQHRNDRYNGKDFDRVFAVPVPRSELSQVESQFILALKPELNGRTSTGKMMLPIKLTEVENNHETS